MALPLDWVDPWAAQDCAGARYLILALPERVRFAGDGFMALAPGAAAPFGIDFAADRMRVFVPLHLMQRSGRVSVLPYVIGPLAVDWRLAQVPVTAGVAGPVSLYTGPPVTVDVAPGPPRVIVQDLFDTEAPTNVIRSNSGAFVLEVFDGRFRVTDADTGALIHSGPGYEPNFSPTSRFVHALGPAFDLGEEDGPALRADLTVIDLFAERPALVIDRQGGGGRGTFVLALHWAEGDSFLTVSFTGEGALGFQQMLHDDRPFVENAWGCGACTGETDGLAELSLSDGELRLGAGGGAFERADALSLMSPAWHRMQQIGSDQPLPDTGFGLDRDDPRHVRRIDLSRPEGRSYRLFDPFETEEPPVVLAHVTLGTGQSDRLALSASGVATRGALALAQSATVNRDDRVATRLADLGIDTLAAPDLIF